MKNALLLAAALLVAHDSWAQGTVVFNNRLPGSVVARVYLGGCFCSLSGNGPDEFPPGAQNWAGFMMLAGQGHSAALLAAPGADAPESSLVQAEPITTFRTGTAAGFVVQTTATLPNVPRDAHIATLQMVAWENKGGIFTNWALAQEGARLGILRAGRSLPLNLSMIGGDFNDPPNLLGLRSFNLVNPSMVSPPVFTSQPRSRLAVVGQDVTFEVAAFCEGCSSLDFMWFFNRAQLPGARGATLVVSNVQMESQGVYSALAWSPEYPSVIGSTISDDALLKVISAPPQLRPNPGFTEPQPGIFQFTLLSDAGLTVGLQRSADLRTWEEFLVVTNADGIQPLTDTGAVQAPCRFYRAVGHSP